MQFLTGDHRANVKELKDGHGGERTPQVMGPHVVQKAVLHGAFSEGRWPNLPPPDREQADLFIAMT